MEVLKRIPLVFAFIIIALISVAKITPVSADPAMHTHTIDMIDTEIDSVLKLTAGATAASAAISLLPDDQCTPISEQFAELGKYFLIVLSALYLEKYLVTMIGYVSFGAVVPLSCAILCVGILLKRTKAKVFAGKLLIAALALYIAIPMGVVASDKVYSTYSASIEKTISIADQISITNEDTSSVDKFISWIGDAAGTIVDYATGLLGRFIEAIAVMIVTSCLIPILVVLVMIWLIKLLFKADFSETEKEKLRT